MSFVQNNISLEHIIPFYIKLFVIIPFVEPFHHPAIHHLKDVHNFVDRKMSLSQILNRPQMEPGYNVCVSLVLIGQTRVLHSLT